MMLSWWSLEIVGHWLCTSVPFYFHHSITIVAGCCISGREPTDAVFQQLRRAAKSLCYADVPGNRRWEKINAYWIDSSWSVLLCMFENLCSLVYTTPVTTVQGFDIGSKHVWHENKVMGDVKPVRVVQLPLWIISCVLRFGLSALLDALNSCLIGGNTLAFVVCRTVWCVAVVPWLVTGWHWLVRCMRWIGWPTDWFLQLFDRLAGHMAMEVVDSKNEVEAQWIVFFAGDSIPYDFVRKRASQDFVMRLAVLVWWRVLQFWCLCWLHALSLVIGTWVVHIWSRRGKTRRNLWQSWNFEWQGGPACELHGRMNEGCSFTRWAFYDARTCNINSFAKTGCVSGQWPRPTLSFS